MPKRVLEQHIAVFGESGSGKTVLVSAFYGLMREERTQGRMKLDVVADDAGQGDRLMQNYLGMSREGRLPSPNRFSGTKYSFTSRVERTRDGVKRPSFDAIRLVWHDYPGEWFHESASGPQEQAERASIFRALLESDVALVLIDGQRLAENKGREGDYLRLLFTNVRNGLLPLVEAVGDGTELSRFPRVWTFALTKSDLLPDISAAELQSLVILHAAHEVHQFRQMLQRALLGTDEISVGEDFVVLSSAAFSTDGIDVSRHVGVDLIMPIASLLPLRRFVRWAEARQLRGKVAEALVGRASAVASAAAMLVGWVGRLAKFPGPVGLFATLLVPVVSKQMIDDAVELVGDQLRRANEDAKAHGDFLRAAVSQFAMDLEAAEEQGSLRLSPR